MKKTKTPLKIVKRQVVGGPLDQMRETVRLIGRAIREGSYYLPTRNLAAAYAAKAAPKDYLGQAENIYEGFLENWRYVKDPLSRELLTMGPRASYKLVMGGDGVGVGFGKGAGDCDCATVALGAMYESTGFKTRIATIANRKAPPGQLMEHVYPEVHINGVGWIPADPVLHPYGGFGDEAPHSRKVVYDLNGTVLSSKGNLRGVEKMTIPQIWKRPPMETYQGLPNFDEIEDYDEYYSEPLVEGFGSLAFDWGCIPGKNLKGLSVDVESEDYDDDGTVSTPVLEVSPEDFEHMTYMGCPVMGCLGLSDDGDVYQFDGFSFKKLLKNIAKGAKKAAKKLKKSVDKVFEEDEKKSTSPSMTFTEAVNELVRAGYIPKKFVTAPQKLTKAQRTKYTRKAKKHIATVQAGKVSKIRKKGTRKPKVKIKKKIVEPIIQEMRTHVRALAPVAAVVPGMGPALKVGLQAASRAGDAVLAETATKTLSELSRISPAAVEDYTTKIANKREMSDKLKDAVKKYRLGQQQLKTAKGTIQKLKKQLSGKVTASEEVDIRATDALRMAQNLLEQQLAAHKKAAQTLKVRGAPQRATAAEAATTARRVPVRRAPVRRSPTRATTAARRA